MRASPQGRWWSPALLLAMGLLVFLAYAPALSGALLFDDIPLLRGYDCWRGLDQVPAMFSLDASNPCTYRPVRYVSYALDWSLASALGDGFDVRVYHVSSLLWHLATALAVFALLRRWGGAKAAALIATVWALHPVHTDAVAYISGRRDLTSTLFYVLAFLLLTARESGGGLTRRRAGLVLGTLFFALAFGAKEMAITLPAVVIWGAMVAYGGGAGRIGSHLRRAWPVYLTLLIGAAAFGFWRGVAASHSAMQGQWWGGGPVSNFATVFALYGHYLQLVVWPSPLIGDYFPVTIALAANFGDPRTIVGLGLYLLLLGLTLVAWRRRWRATAFGLGWFLIAMLPVSHIFPHHELFAEHYLYLPTIGLAVALMPLADRLLGARRPIRLAGLLILAGLLAAMTATTSRRAAEYRSEEAFYEAAHARAPENARAAHYLGAIYVETGRCDDAIGLFEIAERVLRPTTRLGRDGLAARLLCADSRGDRATVDDLVARLLEAHPEDAYGLAMRARGRVEAGDPEAAASDLERALAASRGADDDVVALLARVYNQLGRHADAAALLEAHPQEGLGACEQRVVALLGLGVERYPDAFEAVQRCLLRHPEAWRLYELRAWLFLASQRLEAFEADLNRMEALGAPEEAVRRARALR